MYTFRLLLVNTILGVFTSALPLEQCRVPVDETLDVLLVRLRIRGVM